MEDQIMVVYFNTLWQRFKSCIIYEGCGFVFALWEAEDGGLILITSPEFISWDLNSVFYELWTHGKKLSFSRYSQPSLRRTPHR